MTWMQVVWTGAGAVQHMVAAMSALRADVPICVNSKEQMLSELMLHVPQWSVCPLIIST